MKIVLVEIDGIFFAPDKIESVSPSGRGCCFVRMLSGEGYEIKKTPVEFVADLAIAGMQTLQIPPPTLESL